MVHYWEAIVTKAGRLSITILSAMGYRLLTVFSIVFI